jgi:hypothetical protein
MGTREGFKPNDDFRPFGSGAEHADWLAGNCERGAGCRNYKPEASSSRNGCPMEVAMALASFGTGRIKAKHALRCGMLVEGPGGTLVEPDEYVPCPEYRGRDEPGPPRMPSLPPVDGAQLDMLDPRNEPAPEFAGVVSAPPTSRPEGSPPSPINQKQGASDGE